ncbi:glycyl-radical enzyme activating protein [uncultured Draconibacterium sp.]|uniref:glycyl-radical enzyme activating protein n=1 Tax=uncultured Draconibacterium sp. TaxID=1573823 RepID=UPI003217F8D6
MKQPLIFDIKRYAINDGPGIRITVFLKGCPLSCKWCHNPESQAPQAQKLYTESKCIGAQECVKVCPEDALTLTPKGIVTDYEACTLCGICADVCPTKAIEMSGRMYEVDELVQIIEKERVHIDQSNGGVTFSGGEPLMHPVFLLKMLKACGDKNIHRTVDTCGFSDTETMLEVAKNTELFLFDLKVMDPEKHKKWTGVSNKLILENLKVLSESGAKINIRIPFIKNVNADERSVREMARFVSGLPGEKPQVNILPYHSIAANKYIKLGTTYNEFNMAEPTEKEQNKALAIFQEFGLEAEIGG